MGEFRVAITADFLNSDGGLLYDIGLALFEQNPGAAYEYVKFSAEIKPEEIRDFDGIMVTAGARLTADSLQGASRLAAVAKFGVGFDNIDTAACTDHNVLVFITPEGVVQPVAVSILTYVLALSTRIFTKDRLVRTGRWKEKINHMGVGLRGKTLGSIGFGGIAKQFFRLAAPLGMKHMTYDPYVGEESSAELGVRLVELETLLREADFVCINCPLTASTHHLIGEKELALMKPSAFLVNTARGAIVDQPALTKALQQRRIQGAALDVFEVEPLEREDPLTRLDNVILAPHGLAWTDELFYGNGAGSIRRILQVAQGLVPESVVNGEVLKRADMQAKLARYRQRPEGAGVD